MKHETTLKSPIEFEGIGLHSGKRVRLRIEPAPAGTGYLWIHEETGTEIPADLDHVTETDRQVALAEGDTVIMVVEHVLSALYGMEVDHAILRVWGAEPPILDGSALPYAQAIAETGLQSLDRERQYLAFTNPVTVKDDESKGIVLTPSKKLFVLYGIRYPQKELSQVFSIEITPETYLQQIAPARTFIFLEDVEQIRKRGLAKGGSLENAVVIGPEGILNPEGLRFWDEFVRHKILDLLGDMALTGYRFRGNLQAFMTGHTDHVRFARKLVSRTKGFDIQRILDVIPHRFPFLLVDRILELEEDYVLGVKNVTMNEPFFPGHFPDRPVMPGVLIVEALAQVGGFLLLHRVPDPDKKLLVFTGMEDVRFRRIVVPGDRLYLEGKLLRFGGRFAKLQARAYVGSEIAAELTMTASIIDR